MNIYKVRKLLCNLTNIHPDSNQKWVLFSLAASGFLITYAHPTIIKNIITDLPAEWIAFQNLSMSIAGLITGICWQKKIRQKAILYFLWFAITESTCGCLLGLYLRFVEYNVWIFAITSLVYSSLITTFVGKCIMAFKAKLWNDKARETYDNNTTIVVGIISIAGYLCSLIFLPSMETALFLWAICCIIDDIGWIIVYYKNKEILRQLAFETTNKNGE